MVLKKEVYLFKQIEEVTNMDHHYSFWTYFFSIGAVFLSFLNDNAAAFGVIIAFVTMLGNFYIKWLDRKHGRLNKD